MYLYSERLFHAGFPEFNPGSPFDFSSGSMLVRKHAPVLYISARVREGL